jgi:hypothetical protein
MAQVIATSKHGKLQNSHGGVRFFASPQGKISEEISDEQADQFCEMPDHFTRYTGEPIEAPKRVEAAAVKRASPPMPASTRTAAASADSPTF